MLNWRALSRTQKAYGSFLAIVMLLGGTLSLVQAASLADGAVLFGGISCAFGIIFNPACFDRAESLPQGFAAVPRTCRVLFTVGLIAIALGSLAPLLLDQGMR